MTAVHVLILLTISAVVIRALLNPKGPRDDA